MWIQHVKNSRARQKETCHFKTDWSFAQELSLISPQKQTSQSIFGHDCIISKGHQNGNVTAEYFVDGYQAWWMIIKQSWSFSQRRCKHLWTLLGCPRKLGSKDRISGLFHPPNIPHFKYCRWNNLFASHLLTSWDIQVCQYVVCSEQICMFHLTSVQSVARYRALSHKHSTSLRFLSHQLSYEKKPALLSIILVVWWESLQWAI